MKIKLRALVLALCAAVIVAGVFSACRSDKGGGKGKKTPESSSSVTEASEPSDVDDPEAGETADENGAPVTAEAIAAPGERAVGIDVSKWQGRIDWGKVKNAGMTFAFIRIGYRGENGVIYRDETADYNLQQAEKAGVLTGVYFFSTAVNAQEAEEEAKWTVNAVAGYPVSYPVVYDCEGFRNQGSRMNGLTAERRTANAERFLKTVADAGYDAMLYGAKNELQNDYYWNIGKLEKNYKIWLAYYPAVTYPQAAAPEYSGRYDAWQFTNRGKVPGVEGEVDLAVCYFKKNKQAAKDAAKRPPDASAPPAAEERSYTAVNETVTAKDKTNLRASASTKGDIVAVLQNGQTAKRVGINADTGWSKLEYNGRTVYAVSSYLTTDLSYKPPSATDGFTAVDEQVTAKSETNLRDAPSTDGSRVVHTLKNGETAHRTGINMTTGWSRLEYNGQTVYAVSSYLTTDLSYKPSVADDGFTAVDEQVTAKEETNLRTKPTTEGSEVVYMLKKGEYVRRTGINGATGWSRLEYNGQTVYAITSYLEVKR